MNGPIYSYKKPNVVIYNNNKFVQQHAGIELFRGVRTMLDVQNKSLFDLMEYVDTVDTVNGKKRYPPKRFFSNMGNSCGPDSILFILFFYNNGYFMDIIANSPGEPDPTVTKAQKFRDSVRYKIVDLYTSGIWNNNTIHSHISKFLESTSIRSVKSGTEIWTLFASAFSNLQFPVQTKRGEEIENTPYMAAYLEPIEQNNPGNITSNANHLIYADDRPAKVRDLCKLGYAMEHDNYVLTAAVFFMSGGHYTCAIKGSNKWWYYDDMSEKVKILKNPENGIFNERKSKKSQILFYAKNL